MRSTIIALATVACFLVGQAHASGLTETLGVGTTFSFSTASAALTPYGIISKDHLWPHKIAVCWDNPTAVPQQVLMLVHDTISNSWETAGGVEFTGWAPCTSSTDDGVHLYWLDDFSAPEVKAIGNRLKGLAKGVILNPTFHNWGATFCGSRVETCIRSDAIHEFGHVLGLEHESIRDDAPQSCRELPQVKADTSKTSDANTENTPYDPLSVMNYCNKMQGIALSLSSGDRQIMTLVYGNPFK